MSLEELKSSLKNNKEALAKVEKLINEGYTFASDYDQEIYYYPSLSKDKFGRFHAEKINLHDFNIATFLKDGKNSYVIVDKTAGKLINEPLSRVMYHNNRVISELEKAEALAKEFNTTKEIAYNLSCHGYTKETIKQQIEEMQKEFNWPVNLCLKTLDNGATIESIKEIVKPYQKEFDWDDKFSYSIARFGIQFEEVKQVFNAIYIAAFCEGTNQNNEIFNVHDALAQKVCFLPATDPRVEFKADLLVALSTTNESEAVVEKYRSNPKALDILSTVSILAIQKAIEKEIQDVKEALSLSAMMDFNKDATYNYFTSIPKKEQLALLNIQKDAKGNNIPEVIQNYVIEAFLKTKNVPKNLNDIKAVSSRIFLNPNLKDREKSCAQYKLINLIFDKNLDVSLTGKMLEYAKDPNQLIIYIENGGKLQNFKEFVTKVRISEVANKLTEEMGLSFNKCYSLAENIVFTAQKVNRLNKELASIEQKGKTPSSKKLKEFETLKGELDNTIDSLNLNEENSEKIVPSLLDIALEKKALELKKIAKPIKKEKTSHSERLTQHIEIPPELLSKSIDNIIDDAKLSNEISKEISKIVKLPQNKQKDAISKLVKKYNLENYNLENIDDVKSYLTKIKESQKIK